MPVACLNNEVDEKIQFLNISSIYNVDLNLHLNILYIHTPLQYYIPSTPPLPLLPPSAPLAVRAENCVRHGVTKQTEGPSKRAKYRAPHTKLAPFYNKENIGDKDNQPGSTISALNPAAHWYRSDKPIPTPPPPTSRRKLTPHNLLVWVFTRLLPHLPPTTLLHSLYLPRLN